MTRVLVVDDEESHRESLARILTRAGHEVVTASDGDLAVAAMEQGSFDLVLTDLVMPRTDGMAVLRAAKARNERIAVVLMTAYGTVEHAVRAMQDGADDFITKPARRAEVLTAVERATERQRLLGENRALPDALSLSQAPTASTALPTGFARVVGQSPRWTSMMATLRHVAPLPVSVWLQGPPGCGKSVLAKAIHENSPFAPGPLALVDCSAMPDAALAKALAGENGLLRSPLGSVVIDRVTAMSIPVQRVVVDVLDQKQARPRLIALSTSDATSVRDDLRAHLAVVAVDVPALSARDGDVALLTSHFAAQAARKFGRAAPTLRDDVFDMMGTWDLSGDVRELERRVEAAVAMARSDVLSAADFPAEQPVAPGVMFRVGEQTLEQLERRVIDVTLHHTGYDKVLAAKLLGLSLRTLYRRTGAQADVDES
jgi:two-component system, NtrC family, response regulator HydG